MSISGFEGLTINSAGYRCSEIQRDHHRSAAAAGSDFDFDSGHSQIIHHSAEVDLALRLIQTDLHLAVTDFGHYYQRVHLLAAPVEVVVDWHRTDHLLAVV